MKRLFALVAVSLLFLNPGVSLAETEVVDRVVAVINEDIILLSELNREMTPYLKNLKSSGYSTEKQEAITFKLRQDLLNRMIERTLTDQEVRRLDLTVSDQEVSAAIERLKQTQFLTQDDLEKALAGDGLTYEEYREKIRQEILRPRLINVAVKSKVIVTDEDVRAYYEKHREEYAGKKSFHLCNILIRKTGSGEMTGPEGQPALIREIKDRLDRGEDFRTLARQYSQAPNAAEGGELGTFEPGAFSRQILEAVTPLEQGQYTDILDTDQGYQIFLVADLIQTEPKSFEEIKDTITDKLYAEIVEAKLRSWITSLREKAHIKTML
jgi:peptidyl-prolyl cis-trans isomerase SurA